MDEEQVKKHIGQFTQLLFQKGYRRKFSIDLEKQGGIRFTAELPTCLSQMVKIMGRTKQPSVRCELMTYAMYKTSDDNIACSFRVSYDKQTGFKAHELTITNAASGDKRFYRLQNNQQIAGAQAVQGLFPKPKPWDHILKGRFRP